VGTAGRGHCTGCVAPHQESGLQCGVAVANALPMLKERADLVLIGERGDGVEELTSTLPRVVTEYGQRARN
jgi:hypothetical protein